MILFACCLKLCFKRILMAKKFVQKWPNFFIKYCDFFLKQQWHPLFSFSFFLCWHKNKKGKMQLHKCWYNSFFICPSESYTVVLLSCFPSGFTSISQAHDNADYMSTLNTWTNFHTLNTPYPAWHSILWDCIFLYAAWIWYSQNSPCCLTKISKK